MGMFYSNPSLQLSILSESIDNEINNFNKLLESINILNENNILLLEKVNMKELWNKFKEKIKEIFGKIKNIFKQILSKIKNSNLKKATPANNDNSTDQKESNITSTVE